MTVIAVSRRIGAVPIDVVLRERNLHKLSITKITIEDGSKVSDHAYLEPKTVVLEFADANATNTFAALVRLQESRMPFSLVTGLHIYRNMLIEEINAERDEMFSKILKGRAVLTEIKIVGTPSSSGTGQPLQGGAQIPTKEIGAAEFADRLSGTVARGDSVTASVAASLSAAVLRSFAR